MFRPDFERNTLRALRNEKPEKPVIFELFLYHEMYAAFAGHLPEDDSPAAYQRMIIDGMAAAGYEYATCHIPHFSFRAGDHAQLKTLSLNDRAVITDWESFEKYQWPDVSAADFSVLDDVTPFLPEGMKLMVMGPDGVLENGIKLIGYDNLCYMVYDEPELVQAVFDEIGTRLESYYANAASHPNVGFITSNDDWGFNTQTFLSPADMRRYVFPWHKKIVEAAHKNGKPCLLHSCGCYDKVIDDVIDGMQFDCRHSYEDNIRPIEKAYEDLHSRIAVAGGIDMHFIATRTPEEVYARSRAMMEQVGDRGGYLLGTGNSIAPFIPMENYRAMTRAALELR